MSDIGAEGGAWPGAPNPTDRRNLCLCVPHAFRATGILPVREHGQDGHGTLVAALLRCD